MHLILPTLEAPRRVVRSPGFDQRVLVLGHDDHIVVLQALQRLDSLTHWTVLTAYPAWQNQHREILAAQECSLAVSVWRTR